MKNKFFNFNIYNYKFIIVAVFWLLLFVSGIFASRIGFNKGIDFAGGIVVESACNKCDIKKISNEITKKINISLQTQKTNEGFLLKTTVTDEHEKIIKTFNDVLSKNGAKIVGKDFVSPQMTVSFIKDSIFACIFAFICIGIYVLIRFNVKFAISAIIALVYDVLMVICLISFAKIEVCLITLTAILTIIGYCINDKIVILDRIKGNLDEKQKTIPVIIFESAKNVLVRSAMTSITTIVVAISLLFFGDRLIYDLGITIIAGVIIGTISSLLLVPSLLIIFRIKHRNAKVAERDPMWYAS